MTYYNDIDAYCCEWLGNLTEAGELSPGKIDSRSIKDVRPEDIAGFKQAHFFAGVGGWPLALRLAGWPDDVSVWSGSCPCQPLSSAGKRLGEKDERHLWPEFYRLISECRPDTVFGEQVADADGREWLDGISLDLEELGYAVGAADLCAAGVGAPHIRQRLFWVADSTHTRRRDQRESQDMAGKAQTQGGGGYRPPQAIANCGAVDGLGDATGNGYIASEDRGSARTKQEERRLCQSKGAGTADEAATETGWDNFRIVICRDLDKQGQPKLRRIPHAESGILPLAYGVPRKLGPPLTGMGQVGLRAARSNLTKRLAGYGNAICVSVAVEFVRAYLEARKK